MVQPGAGLEHRIELGVVDRRSFTLLVAHVDPEVLEELQPHRSGRDIPFQLIGRHLTEPRVDAPAEIEIREVNHPLGCRT